MIGKCCHKVDLDSCGKRNYRSFYPKELYVAQLLRVGNLKLPGLGKMGKEPVTLAGGVGGKYVPSMGQITSKTEIGQRKK